MGLFCQPEESLVFLEEELTNCAKPIGRTVRQGSVSDKLMTGGPHHDQDCLIKRTFCYSLIC